MGIAVLAFVVCATCAGFLAGFHSCSAQMSRPGDLLESYERFMPLDGSRQKAQKWRLDMNLRAHRNARLAFLASWLLGGAAILLAWYS